jgi:hypothetical protein
VNPSIAIVMQPDFKQNLFLAACQKMLGRSPARAADAANLSGIPHLMATLSAFRNKDANPTVKQSKDVIDLLHFGCLIAAEDYDILSILEIVGMPFIFTDTLARGIQTAIISGTLRQWQTAIMRGCQDNQSTQIRACFDKLYLDFCQLGLTDLFGGVKKPSPDRTFYLEVKP